MKKRSMLAIASLATGFVVAAVTPSHALGGDGLGSLNVGDAIGTLDKTVVKDALALDGAKPGKGGKHAKPGKSDSKPAKRGKNG
ncbi:hypothetical protein AB0K80_16180 [Streptomyces sp. NPDC052682]|uniref:hypothetical protein n=1 Tax=Streptomyces sp. NPDC052682 TaxID=3154954 RepID=UPI0034420A8A